MVDGKHADVVVACLFAGVGAWGATVAVDTVHTYASELFGEGHAAIQYPKGMEPKVVLTIPGNTATKADGDMHEGSAEVNFTLLGGATFDANVGGLLWDNDLAADSADADGETDEGGTGNPMNDFVTAPGTVASIVSGGRKGDRSITIKIEPAGTEANATEANATMRRNYAAAAADGTVEAAPGQSIAFELPPLSGLRASLSGASKAKTMVKQVSLRAEARVISGSFTNTYLTGTEANGYTTPVVKSRDAVTVAISDPNTRDIVIKGDSAFKAVKQADANNNGNVMLATVTVTTRTKYVTQEAMKMDASSAYRSGGGTGAKPVASDSDTHIYTPAVNKLEQADMLYGLDGTVIDAGLRGVLTVDAMGTRSLFNEGDMLFIDYDGDKDIGGSETIAIDPDMDNMAEGTALSIDPDVFKGGVGSFTVYYRTGGKIDIEHGAMINLTASVDYSDPSATDEDAKKTSTTFNLEGVGNPVMAYAIPHSTNEIGDKANVRVRCESSPSCRVFLECWDDMGMRMFDDAGMIEGDALVRWDAAAIEGVLGITEPTSRHSCRILSVGKVTVQQLTRDGNSGTLVNNTYVGGSM